MFIENHSSRHSNVISCLYSQPPVNRFRNQKTKFILSEATSWMMWEKITWRHKSLSNIVDLVSRLINDHRE